VLKTPPSGCALVIVADWQLERRRVQFGWLTNPREPPYCRCLLTGLRCRQRWRPTPVRRHDEIDRCPCWRQRDCLSVGTRQLKNNAVKTKSQQRGHRAEARLQGQRHPGQDGQGGRRLHRQVRGERLVRAQRRRSVRVSSCNVNTGSVQNTGANPGCISNHGQRGGRLALLQGPVHGRASLRPDQDEPSDQPQVLLHEGAMDSSGSRPRREVLSVLRAVPRQVASRPPACSQPRRRPWSRRVRHLSESLTEPFGFLQAAMLSVVRLILAFGLARAVALRGSTRDDRRGDERDRDDLPASANAARTDPQRLPRSSDRVHRERDPTRRTRPRPRRGARGSGGGGAAPTTTVGARRRGPRRGAAGKRPTPLRRDPQRAG